MNTDDFERQLQRQTLQPPPAAWRDEILRIARSNVPVAAQRSATVLSLATWWRELILPARSLWGALAAAWLVIGVGTVATRESAPVVAKAASPSHAAEKALQAQQQLRAELIGRFELPEADRPKDSLRSPRSERRIEMAVA